MQPCVIMLDMFSTTIYLWCLYVYFSLYMYVYIYTYDCNTYTSYTQVPDESGFVPYHRIPCFDVLVFLNQVKQGMLNFFLFDYQKFGHQKKKIDPHLAGHSQENPLM